MGLGFNTVSSVLILVSFVFLLLATISTPIVSSFSLASTSSFTYGVFGYCSDKSSDCTASSADYPYSLGSVQPRLDWLLDRDTRNHLASTLIIAPIACGFNFVCLIVVFVSHFFSSGILIFSIVFNILTFLLTALIAILVVLMFHPYVSWTGWILVGSAAATLISIVFLFLELRLSNSPVQSDVESINEMATFDNKFGAGPPVGAFMPPNSTAFNRGYSNLDNDSSISKDYEFKATGNQVNNQVSKTMTNSSIYNSNPQMAKDFTQYSNNSFGSRTAGSSHFEDAQVNFVNGPNTPISSKQQMAPTFVPNTATPTTNDTPESRVPHLPYPAGRPLNKPPYGGADMSVFEHHPEVEGHEPFTELNDDLPPQVEPANQYVHRGSQTSDLSDASSDFTSVSQRAINPRYNPQQQYGGPEYLPPQQQYQTSYPQQQPFQPQFQQQNPGYGGSPMMNQNIPPVTSHQQPMMNYGPPPPNQHRFMMARPQPTASDNALANNPDFAIGGVRKKPGMNKPNMGASRMGIPGMGGSKPGQGGAGTGRGPYGMI